MPSAPRGLSRGPYIVVADEQATVLDFMVCALRDNDYCVFQAYDGRAALELCLALRTVDLLITNTTMPGLSGPKLIRQVRQELPSLPILYIRNRGVAAGRVPEGLPADVPTLAEPFTADQLLDAVRSLLAP